MTAKTQQRLISAAIALGLAGVFTLAAILEPSAEGHGTHTQLGLASCSFLQMTGQPCPMCGATTSWSLMAHFSPIRAIVNQPFASLLFAIAVGVFAIATAESIDPRDRWQKIYRWLEPLEGTLALGFLLLMGLGWVYKMAQMSSV
ncbi:MAG: DUF2752 domain-containing protein [Myxococcota bacterium]